MSWQWSQRSLNDNESPEEPNMARREKNLNTYTKLMADFTFDLTFESIPSDVRAVARRYLADAMACALGAYGTDAVRIVRQYAAEKPSGAEATILGTDRKVSAGLA